MECRGNFFSCLRLLRWRQSRIWSDSQFWQTYKQTLTLTLTALRALSLPFSHASTNELKNTIVGIHFFSKLFIHFVLLSKGLNEIIKINTIKQNKHPESAKTTTDFAQPELLCVAVSSGKNGLLNSSLFCRSQRQCCEQRSEPSWRGITTLSFCRLLYKYITASPNIFLACAGWNRQSAISINVVMQNFGPFPVGQKMIYKIFKLFPFIKYKH